MALLHLIYRIFQSKYNLRRQNGLALPKPNTNYLMKSVKYIGTKQWNGLPNDLRAKESLAALKKGLCENVNFGFSIFLNFTIFYMTTSATLQN